MIEDKARTATAIAVAAVLAVGIVGAIAVDPDRGTQQVRTSAPPTTLAPDEDTTTTTTAAAQPPPTSASPATATAAAKPKPKPATTVPRPASAGTSSRLGPRPPGSAVFPFQAGRTSWTATSNGMNLTVSIDKATPRTGEPVTFTMSGSMPDRPCCDLYLVYGDGATSGQGDTGYCSYGQPRPTATSTNEKSTHVYNKAGRWEFLFGGSTTTCGDNMAYGSIYGWIEVAPGTTTSQGPSQPTITVARYGPTQYDNDPSYVAVHGKARDEDGFIARIVVDYGDGTTEEFPGDGMGCRQSASGWPAASMGWTPTNPPPTHKYAAQGTYTITITAYSQGCDGRDVQSVSGSFEHVYQ